MANIVRPFGDGDVLREIKPTEYLLDELVEKP